MNRLTKFTCFLTAAILAVGCTGKTVKGNYEIVPLPKQITEQNAKPFSLDASTVISFDGENKDIERVAGFLSTYVEEATGYTLQTAKEGAKVIHLSTSKEIKNPEGYRLTVTEKGIEIVGGSEAGIFYGVQALRKAMPAVAENMTIELPSVVINDEPRYGYRGMMLDVSRHFFPVDSVKQYIDLIALHNMNTMHWHLSDDQGWRIEIKKYPKLTEVGSKRKETVIGHNSGKYDGIPYEGFYTQEQIKDIVKYAQDRFITIIPEIDLPGHQMGALASYPELGCTGGPYEVWTQWGVSDNVICAGNDKAMEFLENVLGEVIELFPSEYIHVGGDECPKTRWKTCPKCQARIRAEHIRGDKKHSAEEYLQSYVISRMEKFVESKGRHIIGWDEILEGGLAPNATVMSWRGVSGGIEAAKQQHNVVMTPNSYVYFDYYQTTDIANEPMAIGGYLPVERVYSFEPTEGIPAEYQKFVIGVQANLWTEYIPTFAQAQYMVLPRMAALSEVQWREKGKKDYKNFLQRLVRLINIYDRNHYNYATHIFDINADINTDIENNCVKVEFSALDGGEIRYTLDGTDPNSSSPLYNQPLQIKEDVTVKAAVFRQNGQSRIFTEKVIFSKSTAKKTILKEEPSGGYTFKGAPELTNGLCGNGNYKTGRWIGFQGRNLDAVIDLNESTEFSKVLFNSNVEKGDWIMGATSVTVKVSDDGKDFKEIATKKIDSVKREDRNGIYQHDITFEPVKARFVEVIITSDKLPEWHGGAGNPAFLFVDEIMIR